MSTIATKLMIGMLAEMDLKHHEMAVHYELLGIAFGVWLFMVLGCADIGRRYTKRSTERPNHLFLASFYLGTLASLPVFIVTVFSVTTPVGVERWILVTISTVLNILVIGRFVSAPIQLNGGKQKLPLVTDVRFLERVGRIAAKMGLATPLVSLWPSGSSDQKMLAFAGTLQAPELVVTDGILNRMDSDESDAVVGHELGHIANHSLWPISAIFPLSCAITTLVSFLFPVEVALPFGMVFFVGTRRIVTRPIEFDCDYRAARALGFRAMASALAKIHAALPIPNTGILSCLIYATATHPSRAARIAALYDAAPLDDRPEVRPDGIQIRRQSVVAYGMFVVWLLTMICPIVIAVKGSPILWLRIPLWVVALFPITLVLIALRQGNLINQRRLGRNGMFTTFLSGGKLPLIVAFAALVGYVLLFISLKILMDLDFDPDILMIMTLVIGIALLLTIIGGFALWLITARRGSGLQRNVAVALTLHDFQGVLSQCAAQPALVGKSAVLRYHQAIANAASGHRQEAIESLEQLWRDQPHFPIAALTLSYLLLDEHQPQRALDVVTEVKPRLKKDPAVPVLEARALRRLGKLKEAVAVCEDALAHKPNEGMIQGMTAALELDQGHVQQAAARIKNALELVPGDPYLLIIRAEITLKKSGPELAAPEVSQAISAVRNNPFVFLNVEISRLENELAARSGSATLEIVEFVE